MNDSGQITETACRRRSVACGACCGPFNLDFAAVAAGRDPNEPPGPDRLPADLAELLHEREREFLAVDFSSRENVLGYRRAREDRESPIPRHDPGIYVCPFFGPVPPGTGTEAHARPGCMIHPVLTGDPGSQNYSFYGASICQGYDCANKEADQDGSIARTIAELFPNPVEYSRLEGDVLLQKTLRKIPGLLETLETDPAARELFAGVCRARLATGASRRVTSFEITMRPYPSLRAELEELLRGESDEDAPVVSELIDRLTGMTRSSSR